MSEEKHEEPAVEAQHEPVPHEEPVATTGTAATIPVLSIGIPGGVLSVGIPGGVLGLGQATAPASPFDSTTPAHFIGTNYSWALPGDVDGITRPVGGMPGAKV
jgi:hypothetical protein